MSDDISITDIGITVNGKEQRAPRGITVQRLLEDLGAPRERVAVERNRSILPRSEYDTALEDGDCLEIVTFVGGG